MSLTDTLARVLAEHHPAGIVNSRDGWSECECGARLPVALDSSGYALDPDADRAAFDAHRAAEAVAAIRTDEGLAEAAVTVAYGCSDTSPESIARAALDAICGGDA